MARFWFVSAPLYSHTDWGGMLRTALVLQASGHEVIWISEPKLESVIRGVGIEFQPIRQTGWLWPPPPLPDITTLPPQEAVNLRYRRALDTWLSENIVAEATQALIDLRNSLDLPDAIITDPFLSASALAAEALAIPLIVAGWTAQSSLDETRLFPIQRHLGSDSQQRIQRLCDQFGLQGENFSKGATPSIISPHLHISYFTRNWYIAEEHTLLPQNVFVGGLPQKPQDAPPEWLANIPQDVPLALITLGSVFTGDLGFFSWAAQAAAGAGLLPVVVVGWNPIESESKQALINALPGGTRLVNWVPFDHVLPRTHLMIHHGGMGTTHYAVVYGVPQIVVPHAADQRIQARRVATAKVGLHLTAHDVRQGMLRDGAKALIRDQKVQQTARNLAHEMASLGGVQQAAKLILQVAKAASSQ
ncbi:MAG: hypothetical protein Kow00117_04800 [Phototrophicales bacterium]